jgi:hypothetical protein
VITKEQLNELKEYRNKQLKEIRRITQDIRSELNKI